MNGEVYLITNIVTGERYIGASMRGAAIRFKEHLRIPDLSLKIGAAMNKFGLKTDWKLAVLKSGLDRKQLLKTEAEFIKALQPEYNVNLR